MCKVRTKRLTQKAQSKRKDQDPKLQPQSKFRTKRSTRNHIQTRYKNVEKQLFSQLKFEIQP